MTRASVPPFSHRTAQQASAAAQTDGMLLVCCACRDAGPMVSIVRCPFLLRVPLGALLSAWFMLSLASLGLLPHPSVGRRRMLLELSERGLSIRDRKRDDEFVPFPWDSITRLGYRTRWPAFVHIERRNFDATYELDEIDTKRLGCALEAIR